MTKSIDELLWELSYFTGTLHYHSYTSVHHHNVLLTDGVKYLCDNCSCYWLVDYILSVQHLPSIASCDFQSWKLSRVNEQWYIACEDGNKHSLYSDTISYSDFPLPEITVWFIGDVLLLPSEY